MTYFKSLPKINYTFPDGSTRTMVDIYKRGHIKQTKNKKLYDNIIMKGGQTPERLATNIYGDPSLFWQILYANNVISRNDWSLTDIQLEDLLSSYYNGHSFHIFANPEITLRRGDVITPAVNGIPVNPDKWAIIDSYDPNVKKIDSIYFTEDFFQSLENTEVFIWRLQNENVDGIASDQFIQIFSSSGVDNTFIPKKVTRIQSSLHSFKNKTDKKVVSQFNETNGTELAEGLTIGFDSNSTSLIAQYINGNTLPTVISTFTLREHLSQLETSKRSVFVPKKTVTGNITDAFNIVMSSSNALSTYDSVTSTT